jgi:CelD/BcsL family acetyltransferase involved in cellulose biosynthesis
MLSAGDSDGDFIKVAREFQSRKDNPIIKAVTVDESRLFASRARWNGLLQNSNANPLFMSWEWQNAWWRTWGGNRNYQLSCLYLYSKGELVGILPLYRLRRRRWLLKEIHFIGNAWRVEPTVRSEYISPLFRLQTLHHHSGSY